MWKKRKEQWRNHWKAVSLVSVVYTKLYIIYYIILWRGLVAAVAIYLNETCKFDFTIIPTPSLLPKVFGKCATTNICATCAVVQYNHVVRHTIYIYCCIAFSVPIILISKNTLLYYTPIIYIVYYSGENKKFAARNWPPIPLNSSRELYNSLFYFFGNKFFRVYFIFIPRLSSQYFWDFYLQSPSAKRFFSLVYFNPQKIIIVVHVKFITVFFAQRSYYRYTYCSD